MSRRSDLSKLVAEIEWLVKDHSGGKSARQEGIKPLEDEFYTMKITLDIFVKLHQMLRNYIGLLDFRGAKSRGCDEMEIPLKEALDVAVRAMISAMRSPLPKQPSLTPVCLDCIQKSVCVERQSGNADAECESGESPELKTVDKKLRQLKKVTLENVEELKMEIKDVLNAITELPCALMETRLEILSSLVKNTKNKLTSCGRPASLMGTQVNAISQIISEFILEYGQIKSKIYPCRNMCRFCGNVVCPADRQMIKNKHSNRFRVDENEASTFHFIQQGIFCCENARHLNFLWKEWIRQNSVNGVAKWDEDTIMSIVDSFRSEISEENRKGPCFAAGTCTAAYTTSGKRCSGLNSRHEEGDIDERIKTELRYPREEISSSDLSRGRNRGGDISPGIEARGSRDGKNRGKVARSNIGERRSRKDLERVKRPEAEPARRGISVARGIPAADKIGGKNVSEKVDGTNEAFYAEKTARKKTSNKDADGAANLGVALDGDDDSRNKGVIIKSRKEGDDGGTTRENMLDKRQGKSHQKKGEKHRNESDDRSIGNTVSSGMESGVESRKTKRRDNFGVRKSGNGGGDERGAFQDNVTSSVNKKGNGNGRKGAGGSERGLQSGDTDVGNNSGTRKRVNKNLANLSTSGTKTRGDDHGDADWERSSGGERDAKSGSGPGEDSENIVRYRLSNELFIELGWTLRPKDTVVRRIVEFQALQAKPHMNWFKNNRIHGKQYYDDGKTVFLDFLDDGSGHVYYPNGEIAIEAKISQKQTHELYKVYAQGGRDAMGMMRLPWLMGVFDSMGNGVVYDENYDVRITYNQNGGIFADSPTKVSFSWGWNNFQTSPIDEAVYENHQAEQPQLNSLPVETENVSLHLKNVKISISQASDNSTPSKVTSYKKTREDQLTSETQKSIKLIGSVNKVKKQCVAPVKPICLKMNKFLSLRILDRRNINLRYFAGPKSIRIELGTDVNPNVQINSELVDRNDWAAKMTRSRFDMNMIETLPMSSPNAADSVLEIAEEIQRAKKNMNLRQLMIAKYKPHLIPSSDYTN